MQPALVPADRRIIALAPKSELEKLEERIAVNNARITALKVQRAIFRPGALEEHNWSIDRLERWTAIQQRLLLLLLEDYGTLT